MSEEKGYRLGQVARKLNVGLNTIADRLALRGYKVDHNPNARINEEQYQILLKEFQSSFQDKLEASSLVLGFGNQVGRNLFQNTIKSTKIGRITFRLGDMFDNKVLNDSDLIVFPTSPKGNTSLNITTKIFEYDIPLPKAQIEGSISIHQTNIYEEDQLVIYAYFENELTNPETIEAICKSIINLKDSKNKTINLSLLGGLDSVEIAKIYDRIFNSTVFHSNFIVNISNTEDYHKILIEFIEKQQETIEDSIFKPEIILNLEENLSIRLQENSFYVNKKGEVVRLHLLNLRLKNLTFLSELKSLKYLVIGTSVFDSFEEIANLSSLHTLVIFSTRIRGFHFFEKLINLKLLDINSVELLNLNFLSNLNQLRSLSINNAGIDEISILKNLKELEYLNLNSNKITDISSLGIFQKLKHLSLASNDIEELSPISTLNNLKTLRINKNRIKDISVVLKLNELHFLKADNNPLVNEFNLILKENENHFLTIRNFLLRQAEDNKEKIDLPAKVLLLGNHSSGKSSLLHYILEDNLDYKSGTTRIINIERYPKTTSNIPDAIFFDFGGQDYYHGIYRAFLSGGAIYLIVWNTEQNVNKQRSDIDGIQTQDFTLDYWLSQKRYLENEVFDTSDPVLLIQTHSDENQRISFNNKHEAFGIENEFYVSLVNNENLHFKKDVNQYALKYLKASILELIESRKVKIEEPKWFIDFLNFILLENINGNYEGKNIKRDILPYYKRNTNNELELLRDNLNQFNNQGLVLYFKELPDTVWLNPVELVKHVNENILCKTKIGQFKGRVPLSAFEEFNKEIITLLKLQKVIFKHEYGDNGLPEYITPNFLPLSNEENDFELFAFGLGNPLFTLKFLNFLPFGLINQLICFFGDLPDKKKFWRDQLLFTFKSKAKLLIQIDFKHLEIRAWGAFGKESNEYDKQKIIMYLFYTIIGKYWDFELLTFEDYIMYMKGELKKENFPYEDSMYNKLKNCESLYEKYEYRPLDLFISLDEKYFVKYSELFQEGSTSLNANLIGEGRVITSNLKSIPSYPFQPFTKNILKKRKKVAISYSKDDLVLVNEFKENLVPLYENELIERPWYCTDLTAGSEWNEEIRKRFEEADIIFFMISSKLMATKYVTENEIKNAIDRWDNGSSIKIIPIILEHYHWARSHKYDLSKFTALPYKLKPINEFKNRQTAWYTISESIIAMINSEYDPTSREDPISNELKRIHERIVNGDI